MSSAKALKLLVIILIIAAALNTTASQENSSITLTTDKIIYTPGETISIDINSQEMRGIDLTEQYEIAISSKELLYKYLGKTIFPITFSTPKEGEYTLTLVNKGTSQPVSSQTIKVTSTFQEIEPEQNPEQQTACDSLTLLIDKNEMGVNTELKISINNFDQVSKHENLALLITKQERVYRSTTLQQTLVFVPQEIGEYSVNLICNEKVAAIATFNVKKTEEEQTQNQELIQEPTTEEQPSQESTTEVIELTEIKQQENLEEQKDMQGPSISIYDSKGNENKARIEIKNERLEERKGQPILRTFAKIQDTIFLTNNAQKYEDKYIQIADAEIELEANKLRETATLTLEGADSAALQMKGIELEDLNPKRYEVTEETTVKAYAMNIDLDFQTGSFTTKAKGKQLWKCAEWNFETQTCNGEWVKLQDITPGEEYTIQVYPGDPGYAETGLTSINTNQSIYKPGETANILSAVLDEDGFLVEDANLTITVTTPNAAQESYSTDLETIEQTSPGIYEAFYNTTIEGAYIIQAASQHGNMTTNFTVQQYYEFDIIRNTPMTTDPWKENITTIITIISYINETTFNYTENVPASFTITDSGNATIINNGYTKSIAWENITTNSTMQYSALPPLITPELYELRGEITYGNNTFLEARPWYIAVDPAFDTNEAEDIALVPINNTHFAVYWIDITSSDATFAVYNTNGTLVSGPTDIDTDVGTDSRIDAAAINSTHAFISWIDASTTTPIVSAAIYSFSGTLVSSTTVDARIDDNGNNYRSDVAVARTSNRNVVCHLDDQNNDAEFDIFNDSLSLTYGTDAADTNAGPDAYGHNLLDCSAYNASAWVYFWLDDNNGDDAIYQAYSSAGATIGSTGTASTDIGANGQVAVTGFDNNKIAFLWYDADGAAQNVSIMLRSQAGTTILGPTQIDTQAGGSPYTRLALSPIRASNSATNDDVVFVWLDNDAGDIKMTVYDSAGTQTVAPRSILENPDNNYFLMDIASRDPSTNNSICPGRFILAHTNSSNVATFETYRYDGEPWRGYCDLEPPEIGFVTPTPPEGNQTSNTTVIVNVSIDETNVSEIKFNWNGINYTTYDENLVLMYNFDSVAAIGENSTYVVDSSSYNNSASTTSSPVLYTTGSKYDGGINFTGNNGYIRKDSVATNIAGTDFSIFAWIKTASAASQEFFLSLNTNTGGNRLMLGHQAGTSQLELYDTSGYRTSNATITDGNWHYVGYVFSDSTNTVTIYVDGQIAYNGSSTTTVASNDRFVIGMEYDTNTPSDFFSGEMDEVRVWNRALSIEEIQNNYISNLKKSSTVNWILTQIMSNLEYGDYTYAASILDVGDNYAETTTRNITIADPTPLVVSIISPTSTQATSFIDFNVSTSKTTSTCLLSINSGSNINMTAFNSTYFTYSTSYMREGSYVATVNCTGTYGLQNSSFVSFSINTQSTQDVRRNSTNITGTTLAETIDITDPSKAFLIFTVRSADSTPERTQIRGEINQTHVIFNRYLGTGTTSIEYEVVQSNDFYVQRGNYSYSTSESDLNITFPEAVNLGESFILISNQLDSATASQNVRGFWTAEFLNTTTIRLRRDQTGSAGNIGWQVIEWDDANVQNGTNSTPNAGSVIELEESVNQDRSFVVATRRIAGDNSLQDTMVKAALVNSTHVNLTRTASGGTMAVSYFVIEDLGINVQYGEYQDGATSDPQPIILSSAVNMSTAFNAHSHSNTGPGTTYANAWMTQRLAAAQIIELQKGTTSQNGDTSWFVIEFGESPPKIQNTSCYETGSGWVDCTSLAFGDTIDAVRTECNSTIIGGSVYNVSFFLKNAEDNKVFFNNTVTTTTDGFWLLNITDITIADSGSFQLNTICRESPDAEEDVNWTIPWGTLNPSLIDPYTDKNVTKNKFFNFTANVTCSGGECGNITGTLDPTVAWWNNTYLYRQQVNVTTGANDPYNGYQNYTVQITIDSSNTAKFQTDGDDIRIIYYNGSDNTELDRHVVNAGTSYTYVRFMLQQDIATSSSDANYFVYYGNNASTNPPKDYDNVYIWYDNVSSDRESQYTEGRMDSTCLGGGWGSTLAYSTSGYYTFDTTDNACNSLRPTGVSERDVYVEYEEYQTNAYPTEMTSGVVTRWEGTGTGASEDSSHWYYYSIADSSFQGGAPYAWHDDIAYDDVAAGTIAVTNGASLTFPANSWTKLGIASYGVNPTNLATWYDATPLENESGGFVSSPRFSGTHAAGSDNENPGQAGVWLQQDVGRVRNILIRRYTSPEPSATLLSEELGKGVIPMYSGTPFYTITQNPMYAVNMSCLSNMIAGDFCEITWEVNATGEENTTYNFFAQYDPEVYSAYVDLAETNKINITIIGNIAPTVSYVSLTPILPHFSYDLNCSFLISDQNEGDSLGANVTWYMNGSLQYWQAYSVNDSEEYTATLSYTNTSIDEIWYCGVTPYDQSVYGSQMNSSNVTILATLPPVINSIECQENGSTWEACSNIKYNDNLTAVRSNCTDLDGYIANVTFTFTNLEDSKTYFSSTTTTNTTGHFVLNNSDIQIKDSGNFTLHVACTDNNATTATSNSSWSIAWGTLTGTLFNPGTAINVTRNRFFNFTSLVTCSGGECSNINATLDPLAPWWNMSFPYRQRMNITTGANTPYNGYENYTVDLWIDTSSLTVQADGDDVRVVYYNGSDNLEIDRHVVDAATENTHIRFMLQQNESASTSNVDYYIYYGNSTVSAGPENYSNIYLWYDDVSSDKESQYTEGRVDASCLGGGWGSTLTYSASGYYTFDTTDNACNSMRPTSLSDRDVYVEYEEYQTGAYPNEMSSGVITRWVGTGTGASEDSSHWYYYAIADSTFQGSAPYAWHDDISFDDTSSVAVTNGGSLTFPATSWTKLGVASWGVNPTNLAAWYDSTPLENESGSFSVSNRFSGTHAAGSDNENPGQAGVWLQQDVGRVRNILIRRYTSPEPTVSALGEESSGGSKGVIPMYTGNPFYTITQNPMSVLNTSCLGNMNASDTCYTTWEVNATGAADTTWVFFALYESDYENASVLEDSTPNINITIIDNQPPYVASVELTPYEFALPSEDLVCNFTVTDYSYFDTLYANVTWYRNGTQYLSQTIGVSIDAPTEVTMGSINTSLYDVWICGVTPSDLDAVGYQYNSSNTSIVLNKPPSIYSVQCEVNSTLWLSCANVHFHDNITALRANCSSASENISNVTFNVTNLPDNYTYFESTTTTLQGGWYVLNNSVNLNNSGEFELYATCYDAIALSATEFINWTLPWGTLVGSLVNPSSDTFVQQNAFFTFTSNISCLGGECGTIEALLDPGFSQGSPSNGTADAGAVYDPAGDDEEGGSYVTTQALDGAYYAIGEQDTGAANSLMNLSFNISNLSIQPSDILNLTITLQYCHSGENTYGAVTCNGDDPSEKTFSGTQDVWIYNYNSNTWVDIGDLNTINDENIQTNSYSATGTMSDYVNASNFITVRTEIATNGGTGDAWLAVDYAALTVNYAIIKHGPVSTVIGDQPFYTNNSNPYNYTEISCLYQLIDGNSCEVMWYVNATGETGTTHEFWVEYNLSSNQAYVNDTITSKINITITDATLIPPVVTLVSPSNGGYVDDSAAEFICSATDNSNLANLTLYGNFSGTWGQIETINVSGTSNSSSFIPDPGEGRFIWNCLGYDSDGNPDWAAINYTAIIDLTDPAIELYVPFNNTNQTSATIPFSFNATDNYATTLSCDIYIDDEVVSSAVPAINGANTTTNVTDITQGEHDWYVFCYDQANRSVQSETRYFQVLDIPPTVELITPNGTYTNTTSITLQYNASDNNDVEYADLYINGAYNQTNTTVIQGTNSFLVVSLTEGIFNWTVNVSDISNYTAQAPERWFVVDYTGPSITLLYPENDHSTSSSTQVFNFTAQDNYGQTLTCDLLINSEVADNDFTMQNGSNSSRTIVGLPDGLNEWNVICTDEALNANSSEIRNITVAEPPSVSLDDPSNGHSQSNTSIFLQYTPADNTALANCSLLIGGSQNQSNSTDLTNGAQSNFSLTSLGEGDYLWNVNCTDTYNLSNTAVSDYSFTIDYTAPLITLHNPQNEEVFYTKNITFNFTADDNLAANMTCVITMDDSDIANSTATDGIAEEVNYTINNDGIHYWNVTCYDAANNSNTSQTWNFTTLNPPSITLYEPSEGAVLNYSQNVTFRYIPEDSDGLINSKLLINGEINQTDLSPLSESSNYFYLNFTVEGVYLWTVNATDNLGLEASAIPRNVTIDTTPPNISYNFPYNGATATWNNVTFNFTAFDNLDQTLQCDITINGVQEYTNISAANASDILRYKILSDGSYNWNVSCIDHANHTNEYYLVNFTVEAPPIITLNSPLSTYRTSSTSITFNYTPRDAIGIDNCTFIINGVNNETDPSIDLNTFNYFTPLGLVEGDYNWTVSCTDEAPDSNIASATPENFTIDQTGPAITLYTPTEGQTFNDNNVFFNWSATDYEGVAVLCNLTVDGVFNVTNITGISGDILNATVYNMTDGPHNYSLTCIDDLYNPTTSTTVSFIINQPDLEITSSDISFNNTNPNLNETINISVNVSNIGGLPANSVLVEFYEGNKSGGTFIGNDTISVAVNGSTIASTIWNITAGYKEIWVYVDPYAEVQELNETNNNASKNISVLWVEINNPDNNTWTGSAVTNLNFTAYDYTGGDINYTIYVDGSVNGQTGNSTDSVLESINVTLAEGIRTIIVQSTDALGRRKNSTALTRTVDLSAPVPVINTQNLSWFNYSTPQINITITDNLDTYLNYTIYINGSADQSGNTTSSIAYLFNISPQQNGSYALVLEAFDDVGNYANSSEKIIYVDTVQPSITLNLPIDGQNITSSIVNLNFTAFDNLATASGQIMCDLTLDGSVIRSDFNVTSGTLENTEVTDLLEGQHTWNVTCTDLALNANTSETRTFNIITVPIITILSPVNATWSNTSDNVFFFNVSDETGINNCSLLIDGVVNDTKTTAQIILNGTNNLTGTGLNGTHTWSVECYDSTIFNAYAQSEERTIYVDLENPSAEIITSNGTWFNTLTPLISFNVSDNMDAVLNYTFYANSTPNIQGYSTSGSINNTNLNALTNGAHELILEAEDEAERFGNSTPIVIWVDTVAPSISLDFPPNNTNHTNPNIDLNFTPSDNLAGYLMCNLTLDGQIESQDINATNGEIQTVATTNLAGGYHYWNVTCIDLAGNQNTSQTYQFYILRPDLAVNASQIYFNSTDLKENDTINITATVSNIGNTDAGNFIVQFWRGNPYSGGTQINGNITINLTSGESRNVSVAYTLPIGPSEIFVVADAPANTNGIIQEENESNNIVSVNITVGLWHFAFGNTNDRIVMNDALYSLLFDWEVDNSSGSNIFVSDADSSIAWTELQAIGRDTSNGIINDDFEDIDDALNTSNWTDSINSTYTIGGSPAETASYTVFANIINNVPITNSTNNSNFKTGILWDYSDGGTEFNGTQDLIFITTIGKDLLGYNSTNDFEIRIPALLRNYKGPDYQRVDFYMEIK